MKESVFNTAIGVVLGMAIGAGGVALARSIEGNTGRRLTITRADGAEFNVKIYRGEDCRRWGEIITKNAAQPGGRYVCS